MNTSQRLENIIQNAMGLNLRSIGSNTLKNAVNRRMRSLQIKNIGDYYSLVCRRKSELHELIDEIAINETWFFRDEAPFQALQKYAVNWLKRGTGSSLRLLSIPCSTGEEPYSMAISLLESGINNALFSIDAMDISNRALARARKGVFGKRSFRGSNRVLQNRYFKKAKAGYAISKEVTHSVRFFQGNLLDIKPFVSGFKYDIIFCRNLLIYLDNQNQQNAIAKLAGLLSADGIVFTGHAEPGIFVGTSFAPSAYPKAFALTQKRAAPNSGTTAAKADSASENFSAEAADQLTITPPTVSQFLVSPDISEIQRLAAERHFEEAVSLAEKYLKSNAHTPLAYDRNRTAIFLMLGRIFIEMDDLRQAIRMLKKTVYLNPESLEAIDLLANIYRQQGDSANALIFEQRSQRVAMRLTANK